jgi:SAM-dependent methyltransferase
MEVSTMSTGRIELLPYPAPFDQNVIKELGLRGLHVGCGPNLLPGGWLNTDIQRLSGEDGERTGAGRLARINGEAWYLEHDATREFPFPAETFDWIYSEHFIEHVPLEGALRWLKESRRLLKPGGLIRISTPNLQIYMKAYCSGDGYFFLEHHKRLMGMLDRSLGLLEEQGAEEVVKTVVSLAEPSITGPHFQKMKRHPQLRNLMVKLAEQSSNRPAFIVNQVFRMWGHQWIYDFDEIAFVSRKAGFAPDSITRRGFRQGREEHVCGLDDPMHNDESLYVEIRKT